MPGPANSINESTTGVVGFTGTSFPATPVTNHAVIVGGSTSSTLSNVGPSATTGQVLQSAGAAADPAFSTATYPATASGTGTILRANGTNWLASTATYPDTIATGDIHYGSATNVVSNLSAPTVLGSNLGWNATNVYWQNAKNTVYYYDEFFGNSNNVFWNVAGTGGVLVNTSTFPATAGHPGVWALSSQASTTGTAAISLGSNTSGSVFFGGGAISQNWMTKLSALSDGTDTYSARNGFVDSFVGTPQNGAYFTYTHGTNSGRWQIVTVKATVATTSDSGIAADTNFHSFRIDVNAAGTSVSFYIDDVQTSNSPVATNIPVVIIYPSAALIKSAGSTAIAQICDAFTFVQELTTPR